MADRVVLFYQMVFSGWNNKSWLILIARRIAFVGGKHFLRNRIVIQATANQVYRSSRTVSGNLIFCNYLTSQAFHAFCMRKASCLS